MLVPSLAIANAPAPPPEAAEGRVEVWREQEQVCAYGYAALGHDWMHVPDLATFRLGTQVTAFTHPSVDRDTLTDAFERSVLPMALQALGGEALHASAVVGSQGVVALCGESGTGKSTLAHALGLRGYDVWADDAVAFELDDGAITAVSLPFRLNLREESAAALGSPTLASSPEQAAAPLSAVVILRRSTDADPFLRRLEGGKALHAALEQGYSYRPADQERTRRTAAAYLDLVARVPVYELAFAPGFESLGAVVDALEELVR